MTIHLWLRPMRERSERRRRRVGALTLRPVDIARRIGISTAALRNYERMELVPPVRRGANGYRIYTQRHVAYFECISAMSPGFGMQLVAQVLRRLRAGEADEALWLTAEAQAELRQDKLAAEKTLGLLAPGALDSLSGRGKRRAMTIGEVSRQTSVPASAIRHWEQAGLFAVPRAEDSGYRVYGPAQLRQIVIIATLRQSIRSLDTIRALLAELDRNNVAHARRIAQDSLQLLNRKNRAQMRGIGYLYRLVELTESAAEEEP